MMLKPGEDPGDYFAAQVDILLRQAISFCWMALPAERRNVEELEKQVRRLVDRALRDAREDSDAFGLSK